MLSMSFSKDRGKLPENLVFIHLKRPGKEIFYFRQKGECDFVIAKNKIVEMAVQVCYHLNDDNIHREVNGLFEAMNA